MDVKNAIELIQLVDSLEKDGIVLSYNEKYDKEEAWKFIFDKFSGNIQCIINKGNHLPGKDYDDIRRDLEIHLIDVIIPRKCQRAKINKVTGEKIYTDKCSIDLSKGEKEIVNFINYSLTQKYYRMSRDYYVHTKKDIEEKNKRSKEGVSEQGTRKEYMNPLDSHFYTIVYNDDVSELGTVNVESIVSFESKDDTFDKMHLDYIKGKLSKKAKELFELAINCNKITDFNKFIKHSGGAKKTLEQELVPVLGREYGINYRRTRRAGKKKTERKGN